MKKIVALILCVIFLLTGCSFDNAISEIKETETDNAVLEAADADDWKDKKPVYSLEEIQEEFLETPTFTGLNDTNLLYYLEDDIYNRLLAELDSDEYVIQDVSAIYLSKEYIEEGLYNSQKNIFYGYTLAELDEFFGETKYVFTTGEDGTTIPMPIDNIVDEGFTDEMLINIAIGTGVIIICVVICVVTEGAGAPAAAAIFASSAKTGAICAMSGALIAGVSSGVIKGYQTQDFKEAISAAAVSGSEGYKWGAISGAITGGVSKAVELGGMTVNGLTMNEAAIIQKESGYPLEVIKSFHSMDEYNVYKEVGLTPFSINGKTVLYRTDINPYQVNANGKTNLELMLEGKAPFSSTGERFELHHVGQKNDGILAILTSSEHKKNYATLHGLKKTSEIDRDTFKNITKPKFWKTAGKVLQKLYGG